jgi:hypothetical protein
MMVPMPNSLRLPRATRFAATEIIKNKTWLTAS